MIFRTFKEISIGNDGMVKLSTPISLIPAFIRGGSILALKFWKRRTISLNFRDPYVLVVTLDEEGLASGKIYIDDGVSFDFSKGEYIYKTFNYNSGILSSRDHDNKMNRKEFYDDYDCKIEKIIITGISGLPISIKSGEAHLQFQKTEEVLTIIRANLSIKENWEVHVEFPASVSNEDL